jgi:L-asparagine transporter-like permease
MPFFPEIQIVGLALLVAVLITMGLDREVWRISWIVGVPWLVFVSVIYFIMRACRGRDGWTDARVQAQAEPWRATGEG